MIEIGNLPYVLLVLLLIFGTAFLLVLCRKKGPRFAYILCFSLLWVNFALHFLKQLNPYYLADAPYSWRTSTGENLCAVTIMLSPFIYLFGPRFLKGYTALISIISGTLVYLYPSTILGEPLYEMENLLEAIRFYFCHFPLVTVPILLLDAKIVKIDVRDAWTFSFLFMAHMGTVFLNEVCLKFAGLTEATWLDILSRDYRNGALANGPGSTLDVLRPLYFLLPHFYIDGVLYFVPAIWAAVPLLIFGPFIGLGFSSVFDYRDTKAGLREMKARFNIFLKERKASMAYR